MNNSSITLDIKQLSEEIHLAVKTIRSTLVNNPKSLPPRLLIPGVKSLRWLRSDVIQHYSSQKRAHGSNPDFTTKLLISPVEPTDVVKKKCGAPTMAERLAKKRG